MTTGSFAVARRARAREGAEVPGLPADQDLLGLGLLAYRDLAAMEWPAITLGCPRLA
jgi:hypothetical protein